MHVNTRADLDAPTFHIYESHFFTCYSLVYDEDGEQMGYDKEKTFSYEQEIDSGKSWQVMGNSRQEINRYLRDHGF